MRFRYYIGVLFSAIILECYSRRKSGWGAHMRQRKYKELFFIWIAMLLILTACGKNTELLDTYEQIPNELNSGNSVTIDNATDFAPGTKIVVIDPGHGYSDGGTIPPDSFGLDIQESSVALDLSKRIKEILDGKGIACVLTRTTDYDEEQTQKNVGLSLDNRVKFANDLGASVFISVHVDAFEGSGDPNGYGVYYTDSGDEKSGWSASFAQKLADGFTAATGLSNVTLWGEKPSKSYYVTRKTTMPSVLFETGFITNEGDAKRLADSQWLQTAAEGLAAGIENYLAENG